MSGSPACSCLHSSISCGSFGDVLLHLVATILLVHPPTMPCIARSDSSVALMQRIILDDGEAETARPLTVLINSGSASASEILAGALHDAGRAALIGDRTFGKGKNQSVFELQDGSALFVTVARYKTPSLAEIDQVGIKPDMACRLDGMPVGNEAASGMPLDRASADSIAQQLETDSCVLTAENFLEGKLVASAAPSLKG